MQTGDTVYSTDTGLLYVASTNGPTPTWVPVGGGISPTQHKSLRDLIHFIDDGPADGFASGSFKQTFYSGALIASEIWWESAALIRRIVDLDITYTGSLPTTEVWRMYDADGVTVLVTLTDVVTYSGALEQTRTRTWV